MFQFFLLWGINLFATQFNRQAQERRTTRKFKAPIHMALKMRPTGLGPGVYKENVDYGVASMRPAPAPNSCAGIGRYMLSGRRGRRWKRWSEGSPARACPERPARRQGTSECSPLGTALSIRLEARVQEPTPGIADQPKPQKQSLWKWLRSTSGIEKTPQ